MGKKFGIDALVQQALERFESEVLAYIVRGDETSPIKDSPIERLLFEAIFVRSKIMGFYNKLNVSTIYGFGSINNKEDAPSDYWLEYQVGIGNYRVDFILSVKQPYGEENWCRLVIECDGHDFHEKTKEQAARDKQRDRFIQEQGIAIFRFTGSEIWRDPMGCADQIFAWASKIQCGI